MDEFEIRRISAEASDPLEGAELEELIARLDREQPIPSPGFRGRLRRELTGDPAGHRRPARLVAAYAASGSLLIAFATLGVVGAGPLAS